MFNEVYFHSLLHKIWQVVEVSLVGLRQDNTVNTRAFRLQGEVSNEVIEM